MRSELRIPPERDLPASRLGQRREHLLTELARALEGIEFGGSPPISRGPHSRSGFPRRWRRLGASLATAAVLGIALALILPNVLPRGGAPAAAAELRRFAAVAAQQAAAPPLGPGQYYYLREEGLDRIVVVPKEPKEHWTYTAQFPLVREYWVGADGSGRLVYAPGEPLIWPSPRDKARGEADGHDSVQRLVGPTDETLGPSEFVGPFLNGGHLWTLPAGYDFETLPREPEALYEVIKVAAAEAEPRAPGSEPPAPTAEGTFALCTALLHNPLTPADVRAALFKAMAHIPGIIVVPETIPGMGTGAAVFVEVVMAGVRIRYEFLVDPATAELLGYQETQLDHAWWAGADPPFVATSMAYARPRVVDSPTERPSEDKQP